MPAFAGMTADGVVARVLLERAFGENRHREEAEGRRGDPGAAGRAPFSWIATPLRARDDD